MSDNLAIRIYVNKMESKRITFRIKKGYYLELLTPEAMKLLRNPNHQRTKDENDKNVHYFRNP